MKILSVDDSRAIRKVVADMIELLDYDFLEAENGKDALDVLSKNDDVALILLDWNMPVMNGMEFLLEIKANEKYKDIPVTMLTTEVERKKIIEAIESGAKNYVVKPFTQEGLISKVMEALGMGI